MIEATKGWHYPGDTDWWKALNSKIQSNTESTMKLFKDMTVPMSYYSSLHIVQEKLPRDCFLIGEGANTMDIGRTILLNHSPKMRLDAGTYGTMGIGFPYAIAAKALHPDKKVVMVIGDAAFGFSAMELETAQRYGLHLTVIIINNNGIYSGVDELPSKSPLEIPVTAMSVQNRYEKMADCFGGTGHFIKTHEELTKALNVALSEDSLHILNVMIDTTGQKKPQEFAWLTREDPNEKKDAKL